MTVPSMSRGPKKSVFAPFTFHPESGSKSVCSASVLIVWITRKLRLRTGYGLKWRLLEDSNL